MSDILDYYQNQAKTNFSTTPWLAALQHKALDEFARLGFPSRYVEDWKYTTVDSFLQHTFSNPAPKKTSPNLNEGKIPAGFQVVINNGEFDKANDFPAEITVQSLEQALHNESAYLQRYFNQAFTIEHGFQALNAAALNSGVYIHIPAGVRLEQPIVLNFWQDNAQQAIHSRQLIIAEEGSEVTIIEYYQGARDCCYLTNTITEAFISAKANVTHYKIQAESKQAFHIGHLAVKQAKSSHFNSHSISLGGKLVRSDSQFYLQEEHAQCLLNGIYMPSDQQHVDHHTTVHHLVPHCSSVQDYKGVLTGRSRAVFNGKVCVAKNAQQTKAQQQNKNLLLSAQAEIDTKPQLEIFADDVICSHGATVGSLDEDALFYLMTRGIDEQKANQYLVRAFAADNLRLIENKELADWLCHLINQQLG